MRYLTRHQLRPHPHWTQCQRRSKLGCKKPLKTTVLFTLYAKQQAMQCHTRKQDLDPFCCVACDMMRVASSVDESSLLFFARRVTTLWDTGFGNKESGSSDLQVKKTEPQFLPGIYVSGGSRILVRGAQRSFDPSGGPEPKMCSKLPENCMILKRKSWGQGGENRFPCPLDTPVRVFLMTSMLTAYSTPYTTLVHQGNGTKYPR